MIAAPNSIMTAAMNTLFAYKLILWQGCSKAVQQGSAGPE